jgi:hypothetical protein
VWSECTYESGVPPQFLLYRRPPGVVGSVNFIRLARLVGETWSVQSIGQVRNVSRVEADACFDAAVAELTIRAVPNSRLSPDASLLNAWNAWRSSRPGLAVDGNTVVIPV